MYTLGKNEYNNKMDQPIFCSKCKYWVCHLTFFSTSAYFVNGNT